MTKRLTLEFVKERFNERGYELLSDSYLNAHQKLDFRCDRGHERAMTYASLKSGSGCKLCSHEDNGDKCKMDFDFIKASFAKEGYEVLTKNYIDSKQKLEYRCNHGHRYRINWSAWKTGNRCIVCAGQLPKTIEEIRKGFKSAGYTLLSSEYKTGKKLKYICKNKHRSEITWDSWNQGSRCNKCAINNSKNDIEDIRNAFEARGYILLSEKYKNAHSRLDYLCPEKHLNSMSWQNFRHGSECPDCVIKENKKKFKIPIKIIKESFEKEGYTLLTKIYKNSSQKLKFRCPVGHLHAVAWLHWNNGVRCIYCFQENNLGCNNGNWKGGLSVDPYCVVWKDREYKEYLKERDRDKFCWNPQCLGRGMKEVFHHINYIKDDCHPMNVIKICNSCNSMANADRDWWQAFYTEIMRRRIL